MTDPMPTNPGQQSDPPPSVSDPVMPLMIAGAGAAIVIGSFLPWVTITAPIMGSFTASGSDGSDGWVTAAVGILLFVYGTMLRRRRLSTAAAGAAMVGALGVTGLAVWKIREVQMRADDMRAEIVADAAQDTLGIGAALVNAIQVRIGVGLWLLAAAGIVAAAGAMRIFRKPPRPTIANAAGENQLNP